MTQNRLIQNRLYYTNALSANPSRSVPLKRSIDLLYFCDVYGVNL